MEMVSDIFQAVDDQLSIPQFDISTFSILRVWSSEKAARLLMSATVQGAFPRLCVLLLEEAHDGTILDPSIVCSYLLSSEIVIDFRIINNSCSCHTVCPK